MEHRRPKLVESIFGALDLSIFGALDLSIFVALDLSIFGALDLSIFGATVYLRCHCLFSVPWTLASD